MSVPRWIVSVAFWACGAVWAGAAEAPPAAWSAADTALANQYIRSLEQNPEYGRVLDLLWKLYDDRGQTKLLLQYFEEASRPESSGAARILYGHLLRRKGNGEKALEQYRSVLRTAPRQPLVLRSMAEVLREEGDLDAALAQATLWRESAPPGSPENVAAGFFEADLLRQAHRLEEAVALWRGIAASRPDDAGLARRVIALLMEEGRTGEAASALETLASAPVLDAEARLEVWRELGRLREARDEPELAVKVYAQALASLHFRHFKYDGFLTSLLRVRERFGGLTELEGEWRGQATGEEAPEDALWRMVRFAQLTADPGAEEEWLRKLAARAPSNADYRQQLAFVCFRNDHVGEAGRIVEELVKTVDPLPADLVFLRAEIHLRQGGTEAAGKILEACLDQGTTAPEMRKRILRFAETHYLDAVIRRLLLDQKENGWGEEGSVAELKLAAFHHERGRDDDARATLRDYVAGARDAADRARRALATARVHAELKMPGEALALLDGLVREGKGERAHYLLIAELTAEAESTDRTVAALEAAWKLSGTQAERQEVDERLFSLLRAQAGAGDVNAPDQEEGQVWKELWAFYERVKREAPDNAAPELRYRAAWWAVRIGDRDEAYRILPLLHDPDKPVLAYEELLLDLAERTENQALVVRQLELIARIDPRREEEALIRKAEMRLKLNFEDEAIRMLQSLVARPGASLKSVQALAKAYLQQGRHRALEELWGKAFATANLLERREILEPYTETLTRLGKIPDALEIHARMINGESDLTQRRKLFDDQIALASRHYLLESWMRPRYEALTRAHPLDPFYPEGLARVLQTTGKFGDAFAAMKRAYYLSAGESSLLPPLAELASKANDLESAVYFQRQLIAGQGGESPEEWLALIARLEESLDAAGANRVRRELEVRFGQDGDFLRELARASEVQGDAEAALRIWGQVVALRPWDAASLFEFGLLQLELGRTTQAGETFDAVLSATAAAGKGDDSYPLLPAPRADPPPGQPFEPPLRRMAEAVERFPFLHGPQKDDAVAWLLQARSEYSRKPPDARALRLRAIEELARLRGGSEEWHGVWSGAATPASRSERLWAAVHAGPSPRAAEVVQHLVVPGSDAGFLGKFRYCVLSLRTGNDDPLLAWAAADPEKRHHVLLGIDVLLREPGYDFAAARLEKLVKAIGLRVPEARRLMQSLYQEGRAGAALALGETMARVGAGMDYPFYLDVSDLAAELGDESASDHWLVRAFEEMSLEFRVRGRVPFPVLHRIISGVLSLELPLWPRDVVVARVNDRLCEAASLTGAEQTEAAVWIALATGQPERALRGLEVLAGSRPASSSEAEIPLRITGDFAAWRDGAGRGGPVSEGSPGGWSAIEDLFLQVGDRLPFREPLDRMAGLLIDRMRPVSGPGNEEAEQRFAEVRIQHLLWRLESANRPVRQRLIQEFLAMACGEDLQFELALALEKQGMGAEALPVYAELLQRDSSSIEAARGYFKACRETHAYDDALAVLEAYREGSLIRPQSMTMEFLHRTRAGFLFLAGKVEALARIAQEGQLEDTGPGALEAADRAIYQRALVAIHEEAGDAEAAVRVLEALRGSPDGLGKPDQLRLADGYLKLGRDAEATALLLGFKLREGDPNAGPVLRRLGALHARQGVEGNAGLRSLAIQAGRLAPPMEVCLELAGLLEANGLADVADALLELRARRTSEPGARFLAGKRRVELRQSPETSRSGPVLAPDPHLLTGWVRSWSGAETEGEAVLALAAGAPETHRQAWLAAREAMAREPRLRLLAGLLRLGAGEDAAVVAQAIAPALAGTPSAEVRLAASALARHGQAATARGWMAEVFRRREGNPAEDTALMLALCAADRDPAGLREWRDRLARFSGAHSRFMDLAGEFFAVGQPGMALDLMGRRYRSFRVLTEDQRYFLNEYARHLIRQRRLDEAGKVLLAMFQKTLGADPALLVDYYRAAGKLDRLEGELDKYYLSRSERDRVFSFIRRENAAPRTGTSAIR
jgi:Tfp pilus assembly protein PilF